MADVNLDQLIKKDKEKNLNNKKKHIKGKFDRKNRFNKRDHQDNQRSNNRPQKTREDNNRNFKNKIIRKRFDNKNNKRQDNRNNNNKRKENFKNNNNKGHEQKNEQNKQKMFRTLKVMGLSPQFANEDLYKLFATEGALQKCLIEQDNFGRSLTTALVKYHNPESARNAIQNLNKHKIMNCILTVQPYKNVKK